LLGFSLLFPLVNLSLSSNEPPVAAAPKQASPAAIRRATHHTTTPTTSHFLWLHLQLFSPISQPPRAPSSPSAFSIISTPSLAHQSRLVRRQDSTFPVCSGLSKGPKSPAARFYIPTTCLPSHTSTTTYLPARSRRSESRLDLFITALPALASSGAFIN
jgi:hypothetical protein